MCAIFAILFPEAADAAALRQRALRQSRLLRHRGPDWSGIRACDGAILAHERLGLVGLDNGAQPIVSADGTLVLCVNGEIYNHQEIRAATSDKYAYQTSSDCEVIMALHAEFPEDPMQWINRLEGMFAFVLWDTKRGLAIVGRDHIGIMAFVGIPDLDGSITEFPCRHVQRFDRDGELAPATDYYVRPWMEKPLITGTEIKDQARKEAVLKLLHDGLSEATRAHMMCDTPYGVLLSGGLDSSVISALAKHYAEMRIESGGAERAWWPQLHSFAIGLDGAPDLKAAAAVAKHIGSIHHEMHFTIQEGIDALRDVIYHIETYDVTTVRASTPMYLLARQIKAMGIKMVLSGEGADELYGGYLYFHKAPTATAHHQETVRKLKALHQYDCLRANKSMAAWGVEARVPFLDKTFIETSMSIDPAWKVIGDGRIEKHVLREAFGSYLPEAVAWRQKEQFGDGVGYSWIDSIKEHAAEVISDAAMDKAGEAFPFNTPTTKEALLYRQMFAESFPDAAFAETVPQQGKSVACSTAEALEWDASLKAAACDPSGRAMVGVHAH